MNCNHYPDLNFCKRSTIDFVGCVPLAGTIGGLHEVLHYTELFFGKLADMLEKPTMTAKQTQRAEEYNINTPEKNIANKNCPRCAGTEKIEDLALGILRGLFRATLIGGWIICAYHVVKNHKVV